MMGRSRSLVAGTLGVVLATLTLSGCAGGRSVEAFCSTYWEEKAAYLESTNQATEALDATTDPLAGLLGGTAMMAQSVGDIVVMFDKLGNVAPDDIEPDVKAIHDSMKAQLEGLAGAAANPLGALVGGLVQGMATGGSWQRVGDYVVTNCGEQGPS